ncbi:MAG: hypothetical protein EOP53_02300 [Sphingobacteriales bacterium]|nr:MAG: hypothetical protein EOP53_02300 [Sphingobacteriales bacterium]
MGSTKGNQADIAQIAAKIDATKKLLELKLLQISFADNKVKLYKELWAGKERSFRKSFAKNIYVYCGVILKEDFDKTLPLDFFDIESGKLIGRLVSGIHWEEKP